MHDDIISEIDGLSGTNPRQIALLDSTLTQIQSDDYYPSFIDKLTHLMFTCVKSYPLADGNKRTALYIAKAFIKLNHPDSFPTDFYRKLEDVIVNAANDTIDKDELAQALSTMLKGIQ